MFALHLSEKSKMLQNIMVTPRSLDLCWWMFTFQRIIYILYSKRGTRGGRPGNRGWSPLPFLSLLCTFTPCNSPYPSYEFPLHPSDNFPIDHAYFLYCPLVLGFTSFPRLAENWSVVKFIWRDSSYGSNSMFQSKTHNRPKQGQIRSGENGLFIVCRSPSAPSLLPQSFD